MAARQEPRVPIPCERTFGISRPFFHFIYVYLHQRHKKQNDILYGIFLTDILEIWKILVSVRSLGFPCALRHRGICDGDRAFQSLKNGTGVPYAFFVSGRLTAARQETLATSFFILFGCAAVILLSPAI